MIRIKMIRRWRCRYRVSMNNILITIHSSDNTVEKYLSDTYISCLHRVTGFVISVVGVQVGAMCAGSMLCPGAAPLPADLHGPGEWMGGGGGGPSPGSL